jgi:hypothetical protein
MFDSDVLELCRDCLLGAILDASDDADLALAATALSRDVRDTHGADARELLTAAVREAISALDESDLSAAEFATALSRLAWLHERAERPLPAGAPVAL